MKEKETICPIISETISPISAEKMETVLAYLQENQALPAQNIAFTVGTITEDGRLDLCKQNLGVPGAEKIAAALKDNNWVKHLLLGTNKIGNEGAKMLAHLVTENDTLQTLYLGCNHIEAEGAILLCNALENNQNIESLWFKRNPIGKESVPALITLLQKNTYIKTLDLVNTCLGEGFDDFFDYLANNHSLERLYISGNYLNTSNIQHLSAALEKNTHLKALFVSVNLLGDEGAAILAKGLAHNDTLEELSLASCGLKEAGIVAILDAIAIHKKLIYLDLGFATSTKVLQSQANEISNIAAEKLYQFVRSSPQLKYLNLVKTSLSDKYKSIFAAYTDKSILVDNFPHRNDYPKHPSAKAIKSVYR